MLSIDKLTKEQEEKIPEYLQKWMAIGKRTKTIDRDEARKSVDFMYTEIMGIDKPEMVLFFDSPMACQLVLNIFKNLKDVDNTQLHSQLYSQLDSQLDSQLNSQLDSQLRSQLHSQLDSQLHSQLNT